jgi:dihydrofolate reductase
MANVIVALSMSLDGFIAGPNDGPERPLGEGGERLFDWYTSGDTDFVMPNGKMTVKPAPESAAYMREMYETVGALVSGRRTFDIANGWGGQHPLNVPVFVLTQTVPQAWANDGAPFTFVTDGIESAVAQAKAVAGPKDVGVAAASVAQQCIRAGLLDGIHIDLVPVLLGDGVRLFEHLGTAPIELERTNVVQAPGVLHLDFRIVK